jgi:hypothetical protein
MNHLDFIKLLEIIVCAESPPKTESTDIERMRITSSSNVGLGVLRPKQILKVTNKNNI